MEDNLQHEDLLIKLRAKLNEEKVKLWEPPYVLQDNEVSQNLKDLAQKYSSDLSADQDIILGALHELQLHSIDRSKANAEFKETGFATFRIKATVAGEKPRIMKVQKKLDAMGSDLIANVAQEMGVAESRIKLIFNGKVIKPTANLDDQGIKNGAQIMALIMAKTPDEVKREDNMYMEMKSTRDDANLLSQYADEEYMKLEDQSGKTVDVDPSSRRALLVGLTLHERGRAAARQRDYPLALVLLLEADRQLSECSSNILKSVDNWAVLQLDIAWCYLCLQNLSSATDAVTRLTRAEESLRCLYGEHHQRMAELRGTIATERVLLMRLYLLQGVVAYHQNKRAQARALLDKAEAELNFLRVDETAVCALMELGWSLAAARCGLRAARGDVDRAHHFLAERRAQRDRAREAHQKLRQQRKLGLCQDGTPVKEQLVEALVGMGYARRIATAALRKSNNHAAEAVRLIQEQPELLQESEDSSDETGTPSSDDSVVEVDNKLVTELEGMGYSPSRAQAALRASRNRLGDAARALASGTVDDKDTSANPSTSTASPAKRKHKKHKKDKNKEECEQALHRLSTAIRPEDDDHLDTSLVEEEEFLVQYKSLL
ncbi:NEDD8 ultimate buster 1 isoform X2 [Plodia interpunctella]|uniref:NEDD8 ultimate buster 1 isoform X2 n=1 Tax=Plodia interpunctella TaxID=58824 RepID=UPI002367FA5D|nr:NEDD8 ultimate buster 1 isoform X2 [Plodia interpunctella]